jgi:outer membrane protein
LGEDRKSLQDCFLSAVQKSETISDQEEQLIQTHERVTQARGNILPNIAANGTYFVQQSLPDPLSESFFPSKQPTARLTLTQPIFRGLREFAALRQLKDLNEAQDFSRKTALIQLYTDVAQNFFGLLSLEQEMSNLDQEIQAYETRITELKHRARTGQSSASDALTAESTKSSIQAQVKQTQGQYKTTEEFFVFLTGFPQDTKLINPEITLKQTHDLQYYLQGIENRPDILGAKAKLSAAENYVSVAKGEHYPALDFLGNYYLVRPAGIFRDVKWDFQLTLAIPIYSGGSIQAKVAERASQRAQAELSLSYSRRQAEKDIRSFYDSFLSGLEQIQALENAMDLAAKNYLVLKKDYLRGLTRNIEVLQALAQLKQSKSALDRARFEAKFNLIRLELASAIRVPPDIRK